MPDEVVEVVGVAGAEGVEVIVARVWIWIDVVLQIRGLLHPFRVTCILLWYSYWHRLPQLIAPSSLSFAIQF
jgi:hypothetical protein